MNLSELVTDNMAFQPHQQPFPAFGHCDSYFVESHEDDDGVYSRAAVQRDRARGVAKLRQKALAEELSRATAEEYQEDVLDHMEFMEVSRSSSQHRLLASLTDLSIVRNHARHTIDRDPD